jgi:hypothetical protein
MSDSHKDKKREIPPCQSNNFQKGSSIEVTSVTGVTTNVGDKDKKY